MSGKGTGKSIEWSARHVRISYQAVFFSLVFLALNALKIELNLPLLRFEEGNNPPPWVFKLIFFLLAIWFLVAFFVQTKREMERNITISERLEEALHALKGSHSRIEQNLVSFKSPEIEMYEKKVIKAKKEVLDSIKRFDVISKELKATVSNFRSDFSAHQDPKNNISINHLLTKLGDFHSTLLREQNGYQSLKNVLEDNNRDKGEIFSKLKNIQEQFSRDLSEYRGDSKWVGKAIEEHMNAIKSSDKVLNFYDLRVVVLLPIVIALLSLISGLLIWLFGKPEWLGILHSASLKS